MSREIEPFPDRDGRHRDQIIASFLEHQQHLLNELEGNPELQAIVVAMGERFIDRDKLMLDQVDNLTAQMAGLIASLRTAVGQRDEVLEEKQAVIKENQALRAFIDELAP